MKWLGNIFKSKNSRSAELLSTLEQMKNEMKQTYTYQDLEFKHVGIYSFESDFPYPNEYFREQVIGISIGEVESITQDILDLISMIRSHLSELMPEMIGHLMSYGEGYSTPEAIREKLSEPTIHINVDEDGFDGRSWSFCVTEDPIVTMLEYKGLDYVEIWGAS